MRRVGIVLLCEDLQQAVFVRRFLKRRGLDTGQMRVKQCSDGSAEQFVRERYPVELKELRRRHPKTVLIVVIDGDREGVRRRRASLADACRAADTEDRTAADPVVVIVPTWNIDVVGLFGGRTRRRDERRLSTPVQRERLPAAGRGVGCHVRARAVARAGAGFASGCVQRIRENSRHTTLASLNHACRLLSRNLRRNQDRHTFSKRAAHEIVCAKASREEPDAASNVAARQA